MSLWTQIVRLTFDSDEVDSRGHSHDVFTIGLGRGREGAILARLANTEVRVRAQQEVLTQRWWVEQVRCA